MHAGINELDEEIDMSISTDQRTLGEALRLYLAEETKAGAMQVLGRNPHLLSEDALMEMDALRAGALARGDYDLAQSLDARYELLEFAIGINNSLSSECSQAFVEILAISADKPDLSESYLDFVASTAAPDILFDKEKLPPEFQDKVLRAMCCGLLAHLKDPKMWDRSIHLLERALDMPSIHRHPELCADLCEMQGYGYMSTPSGERETNLLKAIRCYGEALAFYAAIPDRWEYGNAQGNLGVAYAERTTGDRFENLRRAEACQTEALKAYPRDEQPKEYAAVKYNLGIAYSLLHAVEGDGALHTAIECFKEVREIDTRDTEPMNYAMVQNSLGNAYRKLSGGNREVHLQKAVACYLEALELCYLCDMPTECARVNNNLGQAYEALATISDVANNLRKAIDYYDKALQLYISSENPLPIRSTRANLGRACGKLARLTGDPETFRTAVRALRESTSSYRPGHSDLDAFHAAWDLGDVAWSKPSWEKAFGTDVQSEYRRQQVAAEGYLRAVEILDQLLAGASIDDQARFVEQTANLYTQAISITYTLGQLEEGLATAERAKGRLILRELSQTNFHAPRDVPRLLIQEEQNLLERRVTLRHCLHESEQGDSFVVMVPGSYARTGTRSVSQSLTRNQLWQELDTVESELRDLYSRMESMAPDYADIRRAAAPSVEDIRRFVSCQERRTTLVSYYTLPDSVLVFGLTGQKGEVVAERIDKPWPLLVDELGQWLSHQSLDNPFVHLPNHPSNPAPRMLSDLSATLLPERIAQLLEGTSLLYVIPTGPLHFLPFHTLLWHGEPLICRFPVVQCPSVGVAIRAQKRPREGSLPIAAFGFAQEPEQKPTFEGEALEVAAVLGGREWVGRDCNRSSVVESGQEAQVLHISSHGGFDPEMPMNSGVALADGRLTAREVMENLRLPGSLVVLSACESGYNDVRVGDDLVGLMRALFYAGASSLMLSRWSVNARTTLDLMKAFYESVRSGESRADALRAGILAVRESRLHPYYWAPFVLLGDWK
jgi:tetratricopeptide (TPR) repeat protein